MRIFESKKEIVITILGLVFVALVATLIIFSCLGLFPVANEVLVVLYIYGDLIGERLVRFLFWWVWWL